MAKLELELRNGDTTFKRTIAVKGRLNKSKAFGTAINDFFRLVALQSNGTVKLFKMNKPFDVIIKYGRQTIDTTKISSELKTKFKLNKTAKRKRTFAKNVWAVLEFMTADVKVMEISELVKSLEE